MTDLANAGPGDALAPVLFGPITRTTLALYAGASGDHNPAHIDIDFARKAGLEDVFAHGMLSMAELARVVTRWAGLGRVESLSTRFLAITPVGATVTCRGEVVERFERNGEPRLRVALTAEIDGGVRTLAGEAVLRVA
ncbi:dehydratase [Azospirillum sp. RWY-5-1]|uniref:Dehydratase n=1 Tax=Azospirillum oleiclasticum TaxID=2735135 RepID=A0ABX2TCK3_9PROT|nr:MaoC/PaaZ C-terminal domain-containing protein [Azospirillum oleiclasticum]NYZ15794.1 dehydratase [Azospirillum oleiclasticum]NYZ22064.1 dehydratase [Azospirillum oleiclasticum]